MEDKKLILVVEDEPKIAEVVQSFLESKGYQVLTAENGNDALKIFEQYPVALVLLDLMLPDVSGEEICMALRRRSRVPIIMLTAKVAEEDMLKGLEIGADDYMTKPFSLRELLARIETVLRRMGNDPIPLFCKNSFRDGELEIDFDQHLIKKNGKPVNLTPNEFKLIAGFIKYPTKVFTREEILEIALGANADVYDRTIDSHIKNLRKKIESDPKNPVYIKTIRGVGYKFGGE